MPLTTPEPQKYRYQRNPRNVGMTLLFAVLTSEVTAHSFTFAHGHELSGCVRADAYSINFCIIIIIMLPAPGPVYTVCIYDL